MVSPGAGRERDLERIAAALEAAEEVLRDFTPGAIESWRKAGGDPVTEADRAVDRALREILPSSAEGWLSEESADDPSRLERRRVWVVDPVDGTREFVEGIPEWCVSVGLVEDGVAVAGGIVNPAAGERFLGAAGLGVTVNGRPAHARPRPSLAGAMVLASRSEVRRGEWERYRAGPFAVVAMGSVAYKLARVAGGLADATWTPVGKHEWDVAAGVALVLAAGGGAATAEAEAPRFNRPRPKLACLAAAGPALIAEVAREMEAHRRALAASGPGGSGGSAVLC